MNLFQMASRGVSLDALPDEPLPEREPLDLGAPAVSQRFTVPDALNGAFDAAAQEYGVDADVLRAMAYAESGFRPDVMSGQVKSRTGATGLLQFMPQTAERFGIDATDPVQSIFGAAAYMRSNLDKFGGDYGKAVAAYNWGENRRAFDSDDWQGKAPDETRNYLKKVFATADDLKARAPKPAPAAEAQPAPAAAPVAAQAPARKEVPGMTLGSVLQDVASGALQIGPNAIKGAADLARLATGDYLGKDLSDSMEGGMAAIRSTVGSDRAAAQRENFNRDWADPNVSAVDALTNNKGAVSDQILPTLGSMLLPVGAAGLAGKAATVGKTAAALDTAALAARVASAQQAAGIGATAAQNAADVFTGLLEKNYSLEDAYKGAGISVPFSVIAGKLTGGGAEMALARQALGVGTVAKGAVATGKAALREGAQEVGEEAGQITGEAVGSGIAPTANQAAKRGLLAGVLGVAVGGGMHTAGNIGAPRVEDQPIVPVAPPVAARQEPTLDVTYENADGQTVTEVIRGNQPAPQPKGTAWSDVAAADKRAQAEAEVARKLAEVDGAPPVVPAATAPADAQAAPVSELTAPVGDIARQVLSGEAIPAAPAAAPAAPEPVQVAPTVEQAEQQLAERESAQAQPPAAVETEMRPTGTLLVKGDVPALRQRMKDIGVDSFIPVDGGVVVGRSQAAKAQQALSAPTPTTAAVTPQQEAANVPQSTPQAAQQPAEAASPAAPVVGRTDAPVPAGAVPAAGGAATAQADGVRPQYSFAGQRAKTADLATREVAEQRIAAGENAEAVRKETGWHKGVDDQWRFEIDDSRAFLKGEGKFGDLAMRRYAAREDQARSLQLDDVLRHPALFAAYPGVAKLPLQFTPKGVTANGRFGSDGVLEINENLPAAKALSVILHEVQHAIQNEEGFASGWSADSPYRSGMRDAVIESNRGQLRRLNEGDPSNPFSSPGSALSDEEIDSMARRNADDLDQRDDVYRRVAGEVEARNTQTRQKLSAEERKATPPSATADVADSDSIVTFGTEQADSKGMSRELAESIMAVRPPARAQMATKDSVQAALDELVGAGGRLPGGRGRIVVANAAEIKPTWEPIIGKVDIASEDSGRAQGFYDHKTKTIFLIADHIKAGQEMAVAAHELLHKHGEAVLGAEGWKRLQDTVEMWADAPEGSTERQVYDEAVARVEASRPGDISIPEYTGQELLPYATQVAIEMGIKPSIGAPLGSVSRWLYQVRTALAQVWTRITDRPETFKTQDLVNLAFGIAQRENPAHRGELDNVTEAQAKPAAEPAQAPATEAQPTMYSRTKPEEAAPPPSEPAAAPVAPERELSPVPEETGFRKVQRVMQDKFNRITVLSNWARDNDIQLSSEADVWGYEARMHGTVATRVEDFREDTVKPLIERIQKAGYSMEQVAEYLHAKHAQERNAQIESIDPSIKDGSGMTNAEAQAILAKAPEKMAALAAEVQAITGSTRQILLDAGIISQEMADAWDAAYKDYVPLKGGDEVKQGGTGKGLSVDGRQKRALGHGTRDEKIVENILRDHERAIMLAEKNKIGQSLLVLVDELNNPEIATIGQPEKRRVLKQGSMFEARTSDGIVVDSFATQQQALNFVAAHPDMKLSVKKVTADPMVVSMASPMLGPNEVQVYLKGHAVRVQLNDELLSRAYQNLGPENLTTLMKINREVNAALSKAYTAYNPEFLLKNIARDFTAGLTITTAKYGAGVAARAVKNYPKAMAQLLRFGFTKKASPSMMSYRLAGGSTGAAYLSDLQRIGEDVRATFDDARGVAATARADGTWRGTRSLTRKSLRFGLKYLEILNAAGESAMRLAVFEAMRETNHDVRESANAAKELLNFNRSGEATRSVGGWFLFLNASIQGTAAVADAMINGKNRAQGWAMVAAMAALQYTLRSLQFGDDDESKRAWKRISDDTKTKNLILRTGTDTYAKMPLPYGLAAFYALGNAAYDIEHGEDVDKVALRVALTFADQFLPVKPYSETGDSRALVEAVPGVAGGELMRAALRAGVNRSGLGGDIVPDSKFDEGKPDNLRAYRSTRTSVYQTIATQLNAASGGTPTQAGLIDVSPETLKYWTRTLTGGAGAFFADLASIGRLGIEAYANPNDPDRAALMPEMSEIPVVRGFAGEDRITDDRRQYWQAAKEVSSALQDNQRAKKVGDEEGLQRVEDKRGELLYFADALKRNSGHIREIRDEVEEIMLDESTSMAFKRAAVKKLEAEESGIYREFTEMIAEDKAEAAKERASGKK